MPQIRENCRRRHGLLSTGRGPRSVVRVRVPSMYEGQLFRAIDGTWMTKPPTHRFLPIPRGRRWSVLPIAGRLRSVSWSAQAEAALCFGRPGPNRTQLDDSRDVGVAHPPLPLHLAPGKRPARSCISSQRSGHGISAANSATVWSGGSMLSSATARAYKRWRAPLRCAHGRCGATVRDLADRRAPGSH